MADEKFKCPECYQEQLYYDARKRLDPRMLKRKRPKLRVICGNCLDIINKRLKVKA